MDDEDKPTALVEIIGDKGSLGEWAASTWLTRYPWPESLRSAFGKLLGSALDEPQTFDYNGKHYEIALRPVRYYKPYQITLLDFSHDKYAGTELPKNFSSNVHLSNVGKGEERDVLIYMNNPLRYEGETFFQAGFLPGDKGTILQVVDNPAAITPYLSCSLVGLGLVVQFMMHLVSFGRKTRNKSGDAHPNELSKNVKSSSRPGSSTPAESEVLVHKRPLGSEGSAS